MKKFGFIQIEFDPGFKKSLHEWCDRHIDPSNYLSGEINGENVGGLVVNDAHITVCYGIPIDTLHKEQINKEVASIVPPVIHIGGINYFDIKEFNVKALYLSIEDIAGTLKYMNDQFKKYVSPDLPPAQSFTPHITIGYVAPGFDEKLTYDGLKEVQSVGVRYYS